MNLLEKMAELERTDPEGVKVLRQMFANARDPQKSAEVRARCLAAVTSVMGDLMMESLREGLVEAEKPAVSGEPVFETRYVRGAKVRVRVS